MPSLCRTNLPAELLDLPAELLNLLVELPNAGAGEGDLRVKIAEPKEVPNLKKCRAGALFFPSLGQH